MNAQDTGTTAGYFNREAAGWSDRYRQSRHFKDRLDTVTNWLRPLPKGLQTLDYGCGSGVLLAEMLGMGHHPTGTDISEQMLASTREALNTLPGGSEVVLEQVDGAGNGAYLGRQYDVITSLGVLEYTDQPYAILEKLVGCLKPGGTLVLSVPNHDSMLRDIERIIHALRGILGPLKLFPHLTGPDNYLQYQKHQFTLKELLDFMGKHGMQPQYVRYHVAPRLLKPLERNPFVAMTVIAGWVKVGNSS